MHWLYFLILMFGLKSTRKPKSCKKSVANFEETIVARSHFDLLLLIEMANGYAEKAKYLHRNSLDLENRKKNVGIISPNLCQDEEH